MTIDEMKRRKRELGYTNEQIAELSGVPYGTVQKIFCNATKAPRRETLLALEKVLRGEETFSYDLTGPEPTFVKDASGAYQWDRQGSYTLEDYYAIPDDVRVELIDGVIYEMGAPLNVHQLIIGELYVRFYLCAKKSGGKYRVVLSPFDVHVDGSDRTMVQPDLVVYERTDELRHAKRYEGAPDLLVEVLSPSSRSHDMVRKLNKYYESGVKEYWIVDPKYRAVRTYDFRDDLEEREYGFEDEIPVAISDGACRIDFAEIYQEIRPFLDADDAEGAERRPLRRKQQTRSPLIRAIPPIPGNLPADPEKDL